MKKLVLYGAGKRGKKIYQLLNRYGVRVSGFCETQPSSRAVICDGEKVSIYSFEEIIGDKDTIEVFITIANQDISRELKAKCQSHGIVVRQLEELIRFKKNETDNQRQIIADYHAELMDDYFEDAEKNLDAWWSKDSIFYQMFCGLELDRVIELACGRGRHVKQYSDDAGKIVLVDILEKNILYCKERFKGMDKIEYYVNNGHDLCNIEDESCSAVFSYDSMVHFELMDVFGYLKEIYRVLRKGGRALLHHSNNCSDYTVTFLSGTCGRNYMSKDLFAYLSCRAGMKVIKQQVIAWEGIEGLDCISLIEK